MSTVFDFDNASADELWDWYQLEYESQNPISKYLYNGFYRQLGKIIDTFEANDSLLEVGCGPGESTRRILKMLKGQHLKASEFEERLVQKIHAIDFPVKVIQESVLALKREDNAFDGIFLLEVLEHIDDYHLALKELFRVARKYVVVSVPHEPIWRMLNCLRGSYLSDWGNTPGHVNHWSVSALKKLVGQYGEVEQVLTPLPWIILLARVKS